MGQFPCFDLQKTHEHPHASRLRSLVAFHWNDLSCKWDTKNSTAVVASVISSVTWPNDVNLRMEEIQSVAWYKLRSSVHCSVGRSGWNLRLLQSCHQHYLFWCSRRCLREAVTPDGSREDCAAGMIIGIRSSHVLHNHFNPFVMSDVTEGGYPSVPSTR